jgi:hypothetical protein
MLAPILFLQSQLSGVEPTGYIATDRQLAEPKNFPRQRAV